MLSKMKYCCDFLDRHRYISGPGNPMKVTTRWNYVIGNLYI